MIKVLLQGLVAFALAALAYAWYGLVMPQAGATVMAVLIGGFAAFSMLSGSLKFSRALLGGAVLAVWPLGVVLAHAVAGFGGVILSDYEALAGAWPIALLASKGSFALAEKRDRARDVGNLSLGAVALYTVLAAVWAGQTLAMLLAAVGVAAIAANARQQLILPPGHKKFMSSLAMICAGAAVVLMARLAFLGR